MLVDHEFHDLYVVESDDRLAVDVGHQTAFPQTCLPCWTSLVHFLLRNTKMDTLLKENIHQTNSPCASVFHSYTVTQSLLELELDGLSIIISKHCNLAKVADS